MDSPKFPLILARLAKSMSGDQSDAQLLPSEASYHCSAIKDRCQTFAQIAVAAHFSKTSFEETHSSQKASVLAE
ncbi:hypothetical protein TNCV_244881 [Trichonephila clavipes]|uniref:Uncharacterized protein n=1 Tax=Trichonephila clavipes TaxID=2585209 RepID=A0A8X6RJX5_TRICX|nr:hypothetical protein TNCV_244881 [Trichonephila clavipes]